MKKSMKFESGYTKIIVCMKFKKPVKRAKEVTVISALGKSCAGLTDKYTPGMCTDVCGYYPEFNEISVTLYVKKSFAMKHFRYDNQWAPEKYLGYYLSRVARKLRKADEYFERRFDTGMFEYEFFY